MNRYLELYGKTYLRCTACNHHDAQSGSCKLFEVACSNGDGCQEKTIQEAEKNK